MQAYEERAVGLSAQAKVSFDDVNGDNCLAGARRRAYDRIQTGVRVDGEFLLIITQLERRVFLH